MISEVEDKNKGSVDRKGKVVADKRLLYSLVPEVIIPPVNCIPFDDHQMTMSWEKGPTAEELNLRLAYLNQPVKTEDPLLHRIGQ
ncbi:hypothetical protein ABZP36_006573 [Zizania latifolia]